MSFISQAPETMRDDERSLVAHQPTTPVSGVSATKHTLKMHTEDVS